MNILSQFNNVDLIYLGGGSMVELPMFRLFSDCSVPPHPVEGLEHCVTGVIGGKIMTCGGGLIPLYST